MTPEQLSAWRRDLESLGPTTVRDRLKNGKITEPLHDYTWSWLGEKERESSRLRSSDAEMAVRSAAAAERAAAAAERASAAAERASAATERQSATADRALREARLANIAAYIANAIATIAAIMAIYGIFRPH